MKRSKKAKRRKKFSFERSTLNQVEEVLNRVEEGGIRRRVQHVVTVFVYSVDNSISVMKGDVVHYNHGGLLEKE